MTDYPSNLSTTPPLPGTVAVPQINSWFSGIRNFFSTAVAPTNKQAKDIYFDEVSETLKRRNDGDTAWNDITRTETQLQAFRQFFPMLINSMFNSKLTAFPTGTFVLSDGTIEIADGWTTEGVGLLAASGFGSWTINTALLDAKFPKRLLNLQIAGHNNAAHYYALRGRRIADARNHSGSKRTFFFRGSSTISGSVTLVVRQNFGTGGSPSADVYTNQKISLTTTLDIKRADITIPSVAGKTFGTNDDSFIEVLLYVSAGANFNAITNSLGYQNGTVQIGEFTDFFGVVSDETFQNWAPLPLAIDKLLASKVSQIGGLIALSGFDASLGSWTMWSDGRMHCDATLNGNNGANTNWVYPTPVPFVTGAGYAPRFQGTANVAFSNPRIVQRDGTVGTTSVDFNVVNTSAARTNSAADVEVKGFWKIPGT